MTRTATDSYEEWETTVDDDGVASIGLTHQASALTKQGLEELVDILDGLTNDDAVDVIVFRGGPSGFCVGMDINEFVAILDSYEDDDLARQREIRDIIRIFHSSIVEIRQAPQPVIAAVDGAAAGGGFSLALASDYVIASSEASFTHAYTNIGATSDGGSTYVLPHLVGMQKAKELVFLPDPISATELAELGVVNEVAEEDFEAAVAERASQLGARPSEAIARTKRLLNEAVDSSFESHLQSERENFAAIATTDAFDSAVREFTSGGD